MKMSAQICNFPTQFVLHVSVNVCVKVRECVCVFACGHNSERALNAKSKRGGLKEMAKEKV